MHSGAFRAIPLDRLESVRNAKAPFPEEIEEEKLLVKGRGIGGRFLQVIFLLDPDGTIFVIHARPLSEREKKQLRRRWRK